MLRKLMSVLLLVAAGSACGKDLLVDGAWVRESVPGQTTASVQLSLTSNREGRLVALSSPVAKSGEMQRLYPSGGKIRAVPVKNVRLRRGTPMVFGERTVTLMLTGLKQPLKVGDQVPIKLTVEYADRQKGTVDAMAEVRALELSYKHYSDPEVHDRQ